MRPLAPTRSPAARTAGALSVALVLALAGCGGSTRSVEPPTTAPAFPPTSGPTTTSVAPPTTRACTIDETPAKWSLARLAAQTVVVPVQESNVAAVMGDVVVGAGGIILFGSTAPADLAGQLATLRAAAPGAVAPFVMTDEEGGDVQRMPNLVGPIPSAREMGATMTAAQISQTARALAVRLRAAGVTVDLAPVLDVDGRAGPNNDDPDGTRSFSANASIASADARAFARGLRDGGVMAVAKHFPGLGGVSGNTDVEPATTPAWNEVQAAGLIPFADAVAAGVPAIMVGNAVVPGLTTLPASISPRAITGALRSRLGFRGLVLTDSLSGAALRDVGYSVARAATAALAAGADMFLYDAFPASKASALAVQTVAAIVAAVSTRQVTRARLESAVAHILAAKGLDVCPGG